MEASCRASWRGSGRSTASPAAAATPVRMSRAGPAAALALKTQSKLSAADNDFAVTAAAGQALNTANAAAAMAAAVAPAAAAAAPARPAAYDFQAYRIASASLPAQPAAVSSAGRRPSQPPAAFRGQFQPQGPQGIRGRARYLKARAGGRPPAGEPKQQQQSGQGIAVPSPAAGSGAPVLTYIVRHFCWISAKFSVN